MDAELPTREEVLAAGDPAALFGGAVSDGRALRRAYAKLIRAFTAEEDPEAFRRIRELFDAARARPAAGEGSGSEESGEAGEAPPDQPRLPADRMIAALEGRDGQAVFDVLTAEADALVASHPHLVDRALKVLLWSLGPSLGPGAVDAVELIVLRPDLELSPADALEMELDILRLRALREATVDEAVPEALLAGLRASWCRRADVQAEAWLAAAEALREEEVDLDALFAHLEEAHPTVLGLIRQTELRIAEGAAPPEPLPEERITALRERYVPGTVVRARLERWQLLQAWWVLGLVQLAVFSVLLAVGASLWRSLALSVVARFAMRFTTGGLVDMADRGLWESLVQGGREPLLKLARARGWFPAELATELTPAEPVPVDARTLAWPPGHPLLELARDPSGMLRTLTDAHVERVRRGIEASLAARSAHG